MHESSSYSEAIANILSQNILDSDLQAMQKKSNASYDIYNSILKEKPQYLKDKQLKSYKGLFIFYQGGGWWD